MVRGKPRIEGQCLTPLVGDFIERVSLIELKIRREWTLRSGRLFRGKLGRCTRLARLDQKTAKPMGRFGGIRVAKGHRLFEPKLRLFCFFRAIIAAAG